MQQLLEQEDVKPVEEILRLIPSLKPEKLVDIWLHLLSYIQGKPKDVEPEFTVEELAGMLEARLPPKV